MPGFRCVHVWGLRCVVGVFVWPRGLWRDTVSLQRDAIVFGADLITQRASLEDTCVSQTDNTMSAGAHQSRASSLGNPYTSFPLCLAHLSITQTCGNAALYCTIWCCGCILTNSNWQAKSFLFVSELVWKHTTHIFNWQLKWSSDDGKSQLKHTKNNATKCNFPTR